MEKKEKEEVMMRNEGGDGVDDGDKMKEGGGSACV